MTFRSSESRRVFLASAEAMWAKEQLQMLVEDSKYNTPDKPSYASPELEPLSFVDWNLIYLCEHPQIRVADYLSNVRLKTRLRVSR